MHPTYDSYILQCFMIHVCLMYFNEKLPEFALISRLLWSGKPTWWQISQWTKLVIFYDESNCMKTRVLRDIQQVQNISINFTLP